MGVIEDDLAGQFTEHRGHLLGVAYRLTGTLSDAEDAVQEAWLRLAGLDQRAVAEIRDLRAWLTTVTGRLCLDRLKSAAAQRERYVGPWLPEPVVTPLGAPASEDPLDAVVRNDGVRMAALVVLQQLGPEQRVAFVLHDAFGVPFPEIADTLGCSPAMARQHASRARRAVAEADPPPRTALEEQQRVLGQFMAALATGDLSAVLEVLHPDVVMLGDSGGKAKTARHPVVGADKVARFLLGLIQRYGVSPLTTDGVSAVLVNGDLGFLLDGSTQAPGRPAVERRVDTVAIRDGKVVEIYDIVNPDKLTRVRQDGHQH